MVQVTRKKTGKEKFRQRQKDLKKEIDKGQSLKQAKVSVREKVLEPELVRKKKEEAASPTAIAQKSIDIDLEKERLGVEQGLISPEKTGFTQAPIEEEKEPGILSKTREALLGDPDKQVQVTDETGNVIEERGLTPEEIERGTGRLLQAGAIAAGGKGIGGEVVTGANIIAKSDLASQANKIIRGERKINSVQKTYNVNRAAAKKIIALDTPAVTKIINGLKTGKLLIGGAIVVWYGGDNLSGTANFNSRDLLNSVRFGELTDPVEANQQMDLLLERAELGRSAIIGGTIANPWMLPASLFFLKGVQDDIRIIEQRRIDMNELLKGGK